MTTAKPIKLPNTPTTNTLVKVAYRIPVGEEPGRWGSEESPAMAKIEAEMDQINLRLEAIPEVRRLKKRLEALEERKKTTLQADRKEWKTKRDAKLALIDRIYLDGPTKQNIAAVKAALGL